MQTACVVRCHIAVGMLCSVFLLVACSVGFGPGGNGDVVIGEQERATSVSLKAGQTLVVALSANRTTGFTWEVSDVRSNILAQQGAPTYATTAAPGVAGAGGTQTFRFKAVGTGETSLSLIYHRPFEKGVAPARTYTVAVTVQ